MLTEKGSGDTTCSDLHKSLLFTYKKLTSSLAPWLLNFFIKIFCQKCILQSNRHTHARTRTHTHTHRICTCETYSESFYSRPWIKKAMLAAIYWVGFTAFLGTQLTDLYKMSAVDEDCRLPLSVNKGCWQSTLRGLRMEKSRILALDSKVHIKGIISMSPDSCIFPYTEKC